MTSAILCLLVPEADAAKLPMRTEYPPHITLCFLGEAADLDKDKVALVARRIAAYGKPVEGSLTGVGRFHGTEKGDAIYASFSSVGLNGFREALVQALERAGVAISHEYGFTPHLTLTYTDPGTVSPIQSIEPLTIRFNYLTLLAGEERHDFPLLGQKPKIGVRLHKAEGIRQIKCTFHACNVHFEIEDGVLNKSIADHVDEHLE